jgi:ribosome biogenesis GTPase
MGALMTVLDLQDLGWSPRWAREFEASAATDVVPGRVALEHNHVFRVLTAHGEVLAQVAGRIKHFADGRHELPTVGDWVALRLDPRGGLALIREILPRRSWFSRKVAGRRTVQQVIAANIDTVFLVFGLDRPVNRRAIERYLVAGRHSGADPVVVLNKTDVCENVAEALEIARSVSGAVPVFGVSAARVEGLETLESFLEAGRTVALLGPSGVGKSSLVNRLLRREVLPTGDVRDWDARGRHTSVHRQLVMRAGGGLIIDTPGLRELQIWETDSAVAATFEDIAGFVGACRFRDCRHDQEPGCAVRAAVADGHLTEDRRQGYLKLRREEDELERKRTEKEQSESKRKSKGQSKALKSMQKDRGR